MHKLVINAKTKLAERIELTPDEIAQFEAQSIRHNVHKAKLDSDKAKRKAFLDTLTDDQREGFKAILKYGLDN